MPTSTNRRAQRANPLDTLGADLAGLLDELDTPPAPAPVAAGMMFCAAPRPPRQSLPLGPSTVFWVAVVACTVVIRPAQVSLQIYL